MNNQTHTVKIIDWTDRKAAMATYRKYEEIGSTGPCYSYYNGKLLPAPEIHMLAPDPVPYTVESAPEDEGSK